MHKLLSKLRDMWRSEPAVPTAFKNDEALVVFAASMLDTSEENIVESAGDSYSRYFATYKPAQEDDSFLGRISRRFLPPGKGELLTERTLTYPARAAIRQRLKDHNHNPNIFIA